MKKNRIFLYIFIFFFLGFFIFLSGNLKNYFKKLNEYNQIICFLTQGTSLEKAEELKLQITNSFPLEKVEIISATDGLQKLKEDPEVASYLKLIEVNPLPHTLIIYPGIKNPAFLEEINSYLQEISQIEEINFSLSSATNFWRLYQISRISWISLGIIFIFLTMVIIFYLTLQGISKFDKDIKLMDFLGADTGFIVKKVITLPLGEFLIGGLIGGVIVYLGYFYLFNKEQVNFFPYLGEGLLFLMILLYQTFIVLWHIKVVNKKS